jgi:hypothetical protein
VAQFVLPFFRNMTLRPIPWVRIMNTDVWDGVGWCWMVLDGVESGWCGVWMVLSLDGVDGVVVCCFF